jgi:enoyl-CoA hydratase/carnithine racemase
VFEIIGPLVEMDTKGLTAFTRMTGELVKAMRAAPQPIVAAVEGICAGAGAIIAMASDLRLAAPGARVAFLFNKVGLAGCDMGACAILPRIVGQGRASELLYTGRFMSAEEGERWGFFSRVVEPAQLLGEAQGLARMIGAGPTYANTMTKRMLAMEWAMSVEEAIEAEAVAQALCMTTEDFARAYRAFAAREKPVFRGLTMSDAPSSPGRSSRTARRLRRSCGAGRRSSTPRRPHDVDASAGARARLGEAGWLRALCRRPMAGSFPSFDVRTLCLPRDPGLQRARRFRLRHAGLGTGPITLFGSRRSRRATCRAWREARPSRPSPCPSRRPDPTSPRWHHRGARTGRPCAHRRRKTWISNGGIADHYVVFARTGEAPGAKGLSPSWSTPTTPGLDVADRIEVIAPHPARDPAFENCRVPLSQRIGGPATASGSPWRPSTCSARPSARAALGFARRALDEALHRAGLAQLFGGPAGRPCRWCQGALGDMATDCGLPGRFLVYRAAWTKDQGCCLGDPRKRHGKKISATEAPQQVIDRAVQLFGRDGRHQGREGRGALSRDPAPCASTRARPEVQKIVIARELLKGRRKPPRCPRGGVSEQEQGSWRTRRMSTTFARGQPCRKRSNGPVFPVRAGPGAALPGAAEQLHGLPRPLRSRREGRCPASSARRTLHLWRSLQERCEPHRQRAQGAASACAPARGCSARAQQSHEVAAFLRGLKAGGIAVATHALLRRSGDRLSAEEGADRESRCAIIAWPTRWSARVA